MGQWFQRFLPGGPHDEVSDATIQGYLRSASQIEEMWQQIDDQVDELIAQSIPPWDAYARLGYALAFVRACRTNIVFVQELLRAAATSTGPGHLPRVTYEQALALCEHIEPYMEEAIKASTSSQYAPPTVFPLELGPRIRYINQHLPLPLPHLQGMIGAAQQMRDWAAGLLAKYELALVRATTPVPPPISSHLEEVKSELKLGDFHIRTGTDMVGQISTGQVTNALSEKAEGFIWEAMESFFKVSQLVANPQAFARPSSVAPHIRDAGQQYQSSSIPLPAPSQVSPAVPDILAQVIAGPNATPGVPPQAAPDLSDMLNQITTSPSQTQQAPLQTSPDVSDMLNQITSDQNAPQGIAAPGAHHVVSHKQENNKQSLEDNVLDMLSDIRGDQKQGG